MDLQISQRAKAMTQPLVNRLYLNEAEYIRLRSVHRILLVSLDAINAEYASNPDMRHAKLQELQGYY